MKTTKLELKFETIDGEKTNININNIRDDITREELKAIADLLHFNRILTDRRGIALQNCYRAYKISIQKESLAGA